MFCSNCGKETSYDSIFCPTCGHKLRNASIQNQSSNTTYWYYLSDNDRKGPVTEQQVADLVANGTIIRGTMVWKEGLDKWIKIEDTSLNHIVQRVMPAAPGNSVSDKWIWALATIPLFVNYILAGCFPTFSIPVVSFITMTLNVTFALFDVIDLKKNGIDAGNWVWLGLILVPIYLFVRSSKTTKNYAPGIIWCILFLLSLCI